MVERQHMGVRVLGLSDNLDFEYMIIDSMIIRAPTNALLAQKIGLRIGGPWSLEGRRRADNENPHCYGWSGNPLRFTLSARQMVNYMRAELLLAEFLEQCVTA